MAAVLKQRRACKAPFPPTSQWLLLVIMALFYQSGEGCYCHPAPLADFPLGHMAGHCEDRMLGLMPPPWPNPALQRSSGVLCGHPHPHSPPHSCYLHIGKPNPLPPILALFFKAGSSCCCFFIQDQSWHLGHLAN